MTWLIIRSLSEDEIKKMREMLEGSRARILTSVGTVLIHMNVTLGAIAGNTYRKTQYLLLRGNGPDKFDLYRQGVIHLKDVPKDILPRSQRDSNRRCP